MAGAVDYLLRARRRCRATQIGVVGFCMGGMLTLLHRGAAGRQDRRRRALLRRTARRRAHPTGRISRAPVRGHFAENDDFFPAGAVKALEAELRGMGKDVVFEVHPGTGHAFANEENALGTYDEATAADTWAADGRVPHEHART